MKLNGRVKWFDREKGFGFLSDQEGNDIFVHAKSLSGEDNATKMLYPGDEVKFEVPLFPNEGELC